MHLFDTQKNGTCKPSKTSSSLCVHKIGDLFFKTRNNARTTYIIKIFFPFVWIYESDQHSVIQNGIVLVLNHRRNKSVPNRCGILHTTPVGFGTSSNEISTHCLAAANSCHLTPYVVRTARRHPGAHFHTHRANEWKLTFAVIKMNYGRYRGLLGGVQHRNALNAASESRANDGCRHWTRANLDQSVGTGTGTGSARRSDVPVIE